MKKLERRLANLEGNRTFSTLGEWMDWMEREENGEPVDWSKVPPLDPCVLKALDELP
ncbi:MAG: hypothetical protein ACLGHC_01860 [Alphaproteobacteria bacterium]